MKKNIPQKQNNGQKQWHTLAATEILEILKSNPESGLTREEVEARHKIYGLNVLTPRKGKPAWLRFLLQFHAPLLYILLAASLVTLFLKEWVDSGVIFGVVLVNSIVGFIQESKAKMMVNVLDMDSVPVRKAMRPMSDLELIPVDSTFEGVVNTIIARTHSRYPVYEGERDNILGYVHIRDLWRYYEDQPAFRVQSVLREAYFIPDTKSILKQLIDFQKKRLHIAFIVDEFGTLKGAITLEDIIEEITGDIVDEHDAILAHVVPAGEGSFIVNGSISLRDLGKFMDREFPEEYDTLSGLIYELLDRIPEEGDKVSWRDMQFKVERMRGNRVSRVRIGNREGLE